MLCTVLIVDDDRILAEGLAELLRSQSHEVATASCAKDAWQMMSRTCPDVGLMDLHLLDTDCAYVLVQQKNKYPDTEYIIITGHGSKKDAATTLTLTARGDTNATKPRRENSSSRPECVYIDKEI